MAHVNKATEKVSTRNITPIAIAVFLGGIGGGIAFPILPLLGLRLGLSGVLIGFILAANRITRLGMNPITGNWIDRIGGKRPLALGLLIEAFSTATFSIALHTTIPGWLLLAGRAVWGIGSSMLIVGGMTLALNLSNERTRGRSTAVVRMAMSLGMPAGLLTGGIIAGLWSDDAAFLAATVSAVIAALISWILIPNTRPERAAAGSGDDDARGVRGAARSSRGEAVGAGRRAAAGGIMARLGEEERIVVTADRRVKIVWLTKLLVFLSIQGALLTTLVLVIHHRGLVLFGLGVQTTAGVLMAVMILSSASITVFVGQALDRIPSRVLISLPAVSAAVIGFAVLGMSRSLVPAVAGLVAIGFGMGGTSIPLLTLLGDLTPMGQRGHTVGIYQFFGDIGGSIGPIAGVELSRYVGFETVYLGIAGLLLVIVLLLLRLRSAERQLASSGTRG